MRLVYGAMVAVIALFCAGPASATIGLVAHWRLDEGAGSTAADDSGLGNAGALSGGATWVTGRWEGAVEFDGSTGKILIPASPSLEPTAVTVAAWVKQLDPQGEFKYVFAKGATGCNAASYGLYTGPAGGLVFYVSTAAGSSYTRSPDAGTAVWDGNWHHAAGTFDGSRVRLFLDGVEVGAGTPTNAGIDYQTSDSTDALIGSYPGCTDHDFAGGIDDVQVWSRALTLDEIVAAMNGQPVIPPPTPGMCTITGTPGNDDLTGTAGRDVICGLGGADVVRGLGGNDILRGGLGPDRLIGARGADALEGGGGSDELVGGLGPDVLRGGGARDRLVGGAGKDALFGGTGGDVLVTRDGLSDTLNGNQGIDLGRVDRRLDRRVSVERLY
jgi:Ca2+-binding RTX toxin-like protein